VRREVSELHVSGNGNGHGGGWREGGGSGTME
jgi:hypothetical protein